MTAPLDDAAFVELLTEVEIREVACQYLVLPKDAVLLTPVERDVLCNRVRSLRQRLADAEAQRDLARRLVLRLPLCQDHRDKFDSEHCQACRAERAEARVRELEGALREVERHCPCGARPEWARPESPATHPHVTGCPVGNALARRTT